jgi:DNA-binding response OmpR family regulator
VVALCAEGTMTPDRCDVLVVEDETDLRVQIQQLIDSWGYRVRAAPSVPAAIAALSESPADIILTDLVIPPDSGTQLLHLAQQRWPEVPVLVMTAFATLENAVEALKLGAYDYLLKPFSPHELSAALSRAHSHIQLRRLRVSEERLRHLTAVALTLTHEINNPLAIISGEVQLMLEDTANPEMRQSMRVCLEEVARIADVVRRMSAIRDVAYREYSGLHLLDLDRSSSLT